jgi:hypothetical protein
MTRKFQEFCEVSETEHWEFKERLTQYHLTRQKVLKDAVDSFMATHPIIEKKRTVIG